MALKDFLGFLGFLLRDSSLASLASIGPLRVSLVSLASFYKALEGQEKLPWLDFKSPCKALEGFLGFLAVCRAVGKVYLKEV